MTTNKQNAETAYAERLMQAMAKIETIQGLIADMPAPSESTNWANVGDAGEVNCRLDEVVAFLTGNDR